MRRILHCRLRMVPFTGKTPLIDCCKQPHGNVSSPVVNWLHEDHRNRPACIRNVTNMFKTRLIGSRPMYRDDILVDGNVFLFANNLNVPIYMHNRCYIILLYYYNFDENDYYCLDFKLKSNWQMRK